MQHKRKHLKIPDLNSCKKIIEKEFTAEQVDSGEMLNMVSAMRTAEHNGHTIEIKTSYEIKVDGQPYMGSVMVGCDGNLHSHSMPYNSYGSAIDFVKNLIDIYPANFPDENTKGGCSDE